VAAYQVIKVIISINPGVPTGIRNQEKGDLPEYICKYPQRLQEDHRLTGAYWKQGVTQVKTGYYAVLKGTSGKFQEVRIEYIKSGELSSWFILIQKKAIWVMHKGLCLSKGKSGLGHETFKLVEEEHK
jgi:hypothetical protein